MDKILNYLRNNMVSVIEIVEAVINILEIVINALTRLALPTKYVVIIHDWLKFLDAPLRKFKGMLVDPK